MTVKCTKQVDGLTVGKEYKVPHMENCDYEIVNDRSEVEYYEPDNFEVIEVEWVEYIGESEPTEYLHGEKYMLLGGQDGLWSVVDETGGDFLHRPQLFKKVKQKG